MIRQLIYIPTQCLDIQNLHRSVSDLIWALLLLFPKHVLSLWLGNIAHRQLEEKIVHHIFALTGLKQCISISRSYHFLLRDLFSFLYHTRLVLSGNCINSHYHFCLYRRLIPLRVLLCTVVHSEKSNDRLCCIRQPHRTWKEREVATYSLVSICIHTKSDGVDG